MSRQCYHRSLVYADLLATYRMDLLEGFGHTRRSWRGSRHDEAGSFSAWLVYSIIPYNALRIAVNAEFPCDSCCRRWQKRVIEKKAWEGLYCLHPLPLPVALVRFGVALGVGGKQSSQRLSFSAGQGKATLSTSALFTLFLFLSRMKGFRVLLILEIEDKYGVQSHEHAWW